MTAPGPGLRERIYLGGYEFLKPPSTFGVLQPAAIERAQRVLDGSLVRRNLIPYTGAADRTLKYRFAIGWEDLAGADQAAVHDIIAASDILDFTPWIEIAERFWLATGAARAGVLARREALSECTVSPVETADRATRLELDGVSAAITLGAIDAYYRTAWSSTGVAGSPGEQATVYYSPLWRVMVTEQSLTYGSGRTNVSLTLEEV